MPGVGGWYKAAIGYWVHVMPGLGTTKVKIQVIDLARAVDIDRGLARANAIGAAPHACARAKPLSSTLERAHWPSAIRPAARWRLARRARWLAGRARASSQSQIYA